MPQVKQAVPLLTNLYKAFVESDCSLLEINPLILTAEGDLLCLDAKLNLEDNALFRHLRIRDLRDYDEEDPMEIEASQYDLFLHRPWTAISAAWSTAPAWPWRPWDIIKHYGGEPANFLDVGGGANHRAGHRSIQDHPFR